MQFRTRITAAGALFFGLIGYVGVMTYPVFADETLQPMQIERIDEEVATVSRLTITGKVVYEPRYTMVEQVECGPAPCKRSQIYWSLVIQSDKGQYLLNQKLNLGNTRAPASTKLGGVEVRPGSIVELDGEIEDIGPNLYSIQTVHRVELVMDLGWDCYSVGGSDENTFARVWRDPSSVGIEPGELPAAAGKIVYKMRVQAVDSRSTRPIAFIESADYLVRSNQWVFSGQSSDPSLVDVELKINEAEGTALSAPADLTLIRHVRQFRGSVSWEAEETSELKMNCSRTRS